MSPSIADLPKSILYLLGGRKYHYHGKKYKEEEESEDVAELNQGDHAARRRIKNRKKKRLWLKEYLLKAGYTCTESDIVRWLYLASFILSFITGLWYVQTNGGFTNGLFFAVWSFFWVTVTAIPTIYLISVLIFFIFTDLIITSRTAAVEKVFPEFLHLTAANTRAGMPIDQALWSAVRPKFGILSKEIETVAKQTMVGESLPNALREFSRKYDSVVLKRTVSLIIEGMDSGSEIGDLLENVALSIEDIQTRKESMAANVTSNVIFIMFSVLFAAPALFAISIQLLSVVHSMSSSFTGLDSVASVVNFSLSLSADAVKESDFIIFCYVSLILSSIMANVIISTIKTGRPHDSVKKIPITIIVSIVVFWIARFVLHHAFSGLF